MCACLCMCVSVCVTGEGVAHWLGGEMKDPNYGQGDNKSHIQ